MATLTSNDVCSPAALKRLIASGRMWGIKPGQPPSTRGDRSTGCRTGRTSDVWKTRGEDMTSVAKAMKKKREKSRVGRRRVGQLNSSLAMALS